MFRTADTRLVEMFIASVALAWAFVMRLPGWHLHDNVVRVIMGEFLPQPVWDAAFVGFGLFAVYAVVMNDLYMRRFSSFVFSGLFAYVSIAFWKCPILLPGACIVPLYAAASVIAYWRLGEAIRYEQMRHAVLGSYITGRTEARGDAAIRR